MPEVNTHPVNIAPEVVLSFENGDVPTTNPAPKHVVNHPMSYCDTLLHIFKGNIGSGLLAMGDAFKNGGIIFSPIMTVVLAIVSVHAQHQLLDCSEVMYKRDKRLVRPGFAETVHLCFLKGPARRFAYAMKIMVNFFLCITQLGFCCVYIVFIATNVKNICDQYDLQLDLAVHMILVVVPILFLSMVRNLKYLTPFSIAANIMMFIGVSIVVYNATKDVPSVKTRNYIGSLQQIPLYLGTAIYAFEGIGLVLPLKNQMAKPEQFQKPLGVLNVGMVIVSSILIVVGFLGYLKWGDDVKGSLTLNLDPSDVLSNVVQGLLALAILLTYPLQFYVPIEITWPAVENILPRFPSVVTELAYRGILVIVTFLLAESIPELGLFISLVGAVSSTALALIFPPLIEMSLMYEDKEQPPIKYVKNVLIILLGFFIFVTGSYESIAAIYRVFFVRV